MQGTDPLYVQQACTCISPPAFGNVCHIISPPHTLCLWMKGSFSPWCFLCSSQLNVCLSHTPKGLSHHLRGVTGHQATPLTAKKLFVISA